VKAVGYMKPLPIEHPDCLLDLEIDSPIPAGRDLLVRVKAVAVNPIDCQTRATDAIPEGQARILGWDAAGVVEAVGPRCSFFAPGDAVFYAGDICRPGCNAEFQLVDERIVGRKPRHLGYTSAATLPLGSLTAWEALFDRLEVAANGASSGKSLLVIGGAGGVGSLAIQLARKVAQLRVIATASRPVSRDWCLRLGAHAVIDHFGDMPRQLRQLDLDTVDYILCLKDTDRHFDAMATMIRPYGCICATTETRQEHDLSLLLRKSASLVWESTFTRSLYRGPSMVEQHHILNAVAALADSGTIHTTVTEVVGPLNAANLKKAHAQLESGRAVGKLVLEGYASAQDRAEATQAPLRSHSDPWHDPYRVRLT
jgi:zinc-binding alcohol dehydrogenase family protein